MLNQLQKFDLSLHTINTVEEYGSLHSRCFFIDGPGGTRQTQYFKTLNTFTQSLRVNIQLLQECLLLYFRMGAQQIKHSHWIYSDYFRITTQSRKENSQSAYEFAGIDIFFLVQTFLYGFLFTKLRRACGFQHTCSCFLCCNYGQIIEVQFFVYFFYT